MRDVPWWSAGEAQLAEFLQESDGPDNLVSAHAAAVAGRDGYPESPGGQRCRDIVQRIEARQYSLQAMRSDAAGKRSLEVLHKNLPRLWFRAYRVDLADQVVRWGRGSDSDRYMYGNPTEWVTNPARVRALLALKPADAWHVDLPPTPDYKQHHTFVVPPLDAPGAYVIVASATQAFTAPENEIVATELLVSDLVLATQSREGELDVEALSGARGTPVAGATLDLYHYDWNHAPRIVATRASDRAGRARFAAVGYGGVYFVLGKEGRNLALTGDLSGSEKSRPSAEHSTTIFTDRAIYRPLQKILWKVVAWAGRSDLGRFELRKGQPLTVFLRDANYQIVDKKTVTTNRFGTAAGEFTVPAGRLLGSWQLTSDGGTAQIRVEEYKRPTFEAKLDDPASPLRLNRPAHLEGQARYYFGLPLSSGTVRWRVTRNPIYPWWWWFGWEGGRSASSAQAVASGTSALDADGKFRLDFTPSADEKSNDARDLTYDYAVEAGVTDEGGETRSASRTFHLGLVAIRADMQAGASFFRTGSSNTITVRRTDLDGVPQAGPASYSIVALEQPDHALLPAEEPLPEPHGTPNVKRLTPGDALRPRWRTDYQPAVTMRSWPDGRELARGELSHDATGVATIVWPDLPPGAYRVHYTTHDAFGAEYETSQEIIVAGTALDLRLPALLLSEQDSVEVGGTARLLALSGLPGQAMSLELYRGGKLAERRALLAGASGTLIEIPITAKDRGGFSAVLRVLNDHQWMQLQASVYVPWTDRRLQLSFATFRDKIRPGTHETWKVTVKAADGRPVEPRAAELLAYMYDRSLDVFAPHAPPDLNSLWPSFTSASPEDPALGERPASFVLGNGLATFLSYDWPYGDTLLFYDSYGVGGPGRRGPYGFGMDGLGPRRAYHALGFAAPPTAAPMVADGRERLEAQADNDDKSRRPEGRMGKTESPGQPAAATPAPLRSNFSETAFWQPQLLTGTGGTASIQFEVPDSVTSWNVWVHALTADLRAGSIERQTQTVKDLLVRPYLPRFLREGDQAQLKVVVNDASDHDLDGRLELDIQDPETHRSLLRDFGLSPAQARQPFHVKKGGGTDLTFPITAPRHVGLIAIQVKGTAGDFSDGELRPLPVLPSRLHLAQSRFVSLRDGDRKTLSFADLEKNDDPTRQNEQLVVTVDGQLFYSVLSALPYLVNYPYECTEQTLNRFLSTGILTSLFKSHPAIAAMAKEMSSRKTELEAFNAPDPNLKMAYEESPWPQESRGGAQGDDRSLARVLDPVIAAAQREQALAKLRKAQLSSGAFPWWPGGPPSPYMTLYLTYGFSKATEFGVPVPKDMVVSAFRYLGDYLRQVWDTRLSDSADWEYLTFLNYVASNFPDDSWLGGAITPQERKDMLDYSFAHWKDHSPYLKGLLSLTLKRMGRPDDAKLVWDSVMDSSKTLPDQGTFWAPEDRSWLWYNDTIETQAFALRTLTELEPDDPRKDGLVLWLFLNKKLNHWKSTRATAEVLYSLAKVLQQEKALGTTEEVDAQVGSREAKFVFRPDHYTGKKNQLVVPGSAIDPAHAKTIVTKKGKGFAFASATWQFSTDELPKEDRGDFFSVSRQFFKRSFDGKQWTLQPLAEGAHVSPGDEIEVHLSLRSKHEAEYVHLRDPRGAGFEPESQASSFKWDLGIAWYEEVRDSGENFFFESLPVGEYTFEYRLRANLAGTFRVGPATVQSMYAPEFNAYSSGAVLTVE
ncbi:MAG TPA: alpha-2-macroglobulin family protein [Myxococcales bacterium]|nr:alpha-2-macroglobulin family protein [Myxococcales bacterium]